MLLKNHRTRLLSACLTQAAELCRSLIAACAALLERTDVQTDGQTEPGAASGCVPASGADGRTDRRANLLFLAAQARRQLCRLLSVCLSVGGLSPQPASADAGRPARSETRRWQVDGLAALAAEALSALRCDPADYPTVAAAAEALEAVQASGRAQPVAAVEVGCCTERVGLGFWGSEGLGVGFLGSWGPIFCVGGAWVALLQGFGLGMRVSPETQSSGGFPCEEQQACHHTPSSPRAS
jgi:hypothetical protein